MRCNGQTLLLLVATAILPSFALTHPLSEGLLKSYSSQLYFEENRGQFDPAIQYQTFVTGIQVRFLESGLSHAMIRELETQSSEHYEKYENYRWAGEREVEHEALVWNTSFLNTSPQVRIEGKEPIAGVINYIKGNSPRQWATDITRFRELWYTSIYPNTDLRYYGTENHQLKYDFILYPGASISDIRMQAEGVTGMELNFNGEWLIHTKWGTITDASPYAYQLINGRETEVKVQYTPAGKNTIGFKVIGEYDTSLPLVIDPLTLNWSTFLHASTSDDYVIAVDRDAQENIYLTGYTKSLAFPVTTGVYQNNYTGGIDCYITKMDPNGSFIYYSTYIGGTDWELPYAIHVTANNEPIIAGFGSSTNYPYTSGSIQPASGGGLSDGFITKLSASGNSLEYSSYLGGTDRDYIYDMAVGPGGEAYLTGYTLSHDFPVTSGAYSNSVGGYGDIFVAKVSADGSTLDYSTLVSGTNFDIANSIAINSNGDAFVAGNTGSSDLPATSGAYQNSASFAGSGLDEDAFVLRLSADGSTLKYLTYLGGSDTDAAYSLDINVNDEVFVTGVTYSTNFPTTTTAFQTGTSSNLGSGDLFVARLSSSGSSMTYGTYLGGTDVDFCKSIRVNSNNEAHILGASRSYNYPVTTGSAAHTALYDIVVSILSSDGSSLVQSAYYGGSYNEYPRSSGSMYLDGNKMTIGITTHSANMPMTAGTYQTAKTNGTADAPWIGTIETGTVLPVEMKSFTAAWQEAISLPVLRWETGEETGTVEFEIERKTEASDWEQIGLVSGNSGSNHQYTFTDHQVPADESRLFYRIRYQSLDGDMYHSVVREVTVPANPLLALSVYPNPADDILHISYESGSEDYYRLEIMSIDGRIIYQTVQMNSSSGKRRLDISHWASGIYTLRLIPVHGSPLTKKLVVR